MSKRKPKAQETLIDKAAAALKGGFPVVSLDRTGGLWVGSDAFLTKTKKGLALHFAVEAVRGFRQDLSKALRGAGVPFEPGMDYEFDAKTGSITFIAPDESTTTGHRWIGKATKWPHVLRCLMCKELIAHAAVADDDYLEEVKEIVSKHMAEAGADAKGHACQYAGCVHHEELPRAVAEALVRMQDAQKTKDARGIPFATIDLEATEKDHPPGFDLKRQDAAQRGEDAMTAGDVYVRLGPKVCQAHVWISPAYVSRRAKREDPAAVWEIIEAMQKRMPGHAKWAINKYNGLKELAQMDADLEGDDGKDAKDSKEGR